LAILGYVAACCTTLSFVPQISKIKRQGGKDLSYTMLGIYLAGLILWLLYGIILRAAPIIVANVASIILVGYAIAMKATFSKPPAID
jgi:MtN3 and saliva related transmembrane protein